MEIFVAAVREGSLSAAARRLDRTPSAVSRALAR
ncbi:helix-turn-helix domain-containing protein, partial [Klebsiella pneumoniae]